MAKHPAPPTAAIVLGLAGLLPLAGAAVALGLDNEKRPVDAGLVFFVLPGLAYAALILSFLGGMWWSAACNHLDESRLGPWLAVAVTPTMWAIGSFFAAIAVAGVHGTGGEIRAAGVGLAAGLLLTLLVDRAAVRAGLVPVWWMRLRVPLSIGLAAETLVVAWLA